MRKPMLAGVLTMAAAAAVACSKPADHPAGQPADGAAGAGAVASDAAAAPASMAEALKPKRKVGLWRMSMSHTGGPGMSMTAEMCVGEKSSADFNFDPRGASKDCANSRSTPTANGWSFESVCKVEGRTVTTKGSITGDMSSNYSMEANSRMDPAPEGMPAVTSTKVQAKWLGPCPAGMKPDSIRVAGMNIGG